MQSGKVPEGMTKGPLPPGSSFAILRGSDAFSLVLTEPGPESPKIYPSDFHVGFTIETPEEVRTKHQELCDSGLEPEPINTFSAMGKNWTAFYCPVGDGIRIEVNASA